ncbi:MAG: CvpA family protein [Bacteroidales bacterium]|nr:CvpA family protein [Bacteroidales bacterium]
MNFFDFVLLVLILLFIVHGYRKGIIISLAGIAALILGIYAAVHFSNYLDATLLEHVKPSRKWLPILSFSITFLLVLFGVILVGKLTEKVVDIVGLGFLNRLGGALLGLVKGAILVSIFIFILSCIDPKEKWMTSKDKQGSFFYSPVSKVFPKLMKLIGGDIKFPNW